MADEDTKVTFDFKKISVILGVLITIGSLGIAAYTNFNSYHDKFALKQETEAIHNEIHTELDSSIHDLQVEILTVAKLAYEDQLVELDYLQATGKATDLDKANRANVERRLGDLKGKLATFGK